MTQPPITPKTYNQSKLNLLFQAPFLLQLLNHRLDVFFHLLGDVFRQNAKQQFLLLVPFKLQRQIFLHTLPPVEKVSPDVDLVRDAEVNAQEIYANEKENLRHDLDDFVVVRRVGDKHHDDGIANTRHEAH